MARRTEDKWEPIDSLGTTGATVARNIRRIRQARGLAYTELSQHLEVLGREIPTWGLRKIESGGRRVDVDDLMALAVSLRVSPATFLMPLTNDDGSDVQLGDLVPITGWQKPVPARVVWEWISARSPLVKGTMASFLQLALPVWERERFEADMRAAQQRMLEQMYREVPGGVPDHLREDVGDGED